MTDHIDTPVEVAAKAAIAKALRVSERVIAALVVLFVLMAGIVGYLTYESVTHPVASQLKSETVQNALSIKDLETYVQQYAQHGCQALELLTSVPVHKPANPAANPSRETTYQFYEAILYWEHADGCTLTSVPVAHG